MLLLLLLLPLLPNLSVIGRSSWSAGQLPYCPKQICWMTAKQREQQV
jgi:putative AlgH/UPF0301 family transcriptional regulator